MTSAKSPFEIVEVNETWVGLCGFSHDEAVGKGVDQLLHGPKTDTEQARDIVHRLSTEDYVEKELINYTKEGRPFRNIIRAAPIHSESGEIEFFVGVLAEVKATSQNC